MFRYGRRFSGNLTFDKTVTDKTKPFRLEEKVAEAARDNVRFIDYVSDDRILTTIPCDLVLML